MRYLEPLLAFVALLWLLMHSLLTTRAEREWQQKAEIILALCGLSLFGLIIYERYSSSTHAFYTLKGFLGGISVGVFVTLWLEGSLNLLTRLKSRESDAPNRGS
jgi:hypothetical protein